jgi:hypothetical protein
MNSVPQFTLPIPPARMFENKKWVERLQGFGIPLDQAQSIAQKLSRDVYLMPPDIQADYFKVNF